MQQTDKKYYPVLVKYSESQSLAIIEELTKQGREIRVNCISCFNLWIGSDEFSVLQSQLPCKFDVDTYTIYRPKKVSYIMIHLVTSFTFVIK